MIRVLDADHAGVFDGVASSRLASIVRWCRRRRHCYHQCRPPDAARKYVLKACSSHLLMCTHTPLGARGQRWASSVLCCAPCVLTRDGRNLRGLGRREQRRDAPFACVSRMAPFPRGTAHHDQHDQRSPFPRSWCLAVAGRSLAFRVHARLAP